MRRRLSLLIAFIGVLGLIGLTPAAQADHDGGAKNDGKHENIPTPPVPGEIGAACQVAGEVMVGDSAGVGGVSASHQNHNHYRFKGTTITCTALDAAFDDFEGDFDVDATGGTDGADGLHDHDDDPMTEPIEAHGEDALTGWSHQDGYHGTDACIFDHKVHGCQSDLYDGTSLAPSTNPNGCDNCGEIWATNTSGNKSSDVSTDNAVLFVREGTNVEAWGILHPNNGKAPVCFLAELEFIPEMKDPGEKVNEAELVGTAELWFGDKDKEPGDCAVDQGDNKK